jgi:cytochrome c oxidase cbb3-type subunit 3
MAPRRAAAVLASLAAACLAQPGSNGVRDAAADPSNSAYPIGPVPGPAASSAKPANPFTGDAKAMAEGRRMFVRFNCSGCHGGRAGGGMGPSLRDDTWLYGSQEADIFDSIAQGRGKGMPAWRTRLAPDDIWRLVTYIKSLRTQQEPDAPR